METTANFKAGLQAAYDELNRDGKISATDQATVGKLLSEPLLPRGQRFIAMKRAHFRVRRLYARKTGALLPFEIDWTKIVEWIKAHWLDIVKILVSLLVFI